MNLQIVGALIFSQVPEVGYSVGLKVGVTAPIGPDTLSAADDNEVAVTWRLRRREPIQRGRLRRMSARWVDDPTDNNHGNLALGSAALSGDICQVSATARAENYADYLNAVPWTGTVAVGDLAFGGATIPTYSGVLRIGGYREVTVPQFSDRRQQYRRHLGWLARRRCRYGWERSR